MLTSTSSCIFCSFLCHFKSRARNYKRNRLVQGTSSPKIYLSEHLRACPDLLATNQLNYQLILQNLSRGQVPFKSTCSPPFLLVPDNRTICFFEPWNLVTSVKLETGNSILATHLPCTLLLVWVLCTKTYFIALLIRFIFAFITLVCGVLHVV